MRHVGTSRMYRRGVQTTHDDIALAFFSSNGKTAGVVPVQTFLHCHADRLEAPCAGALGWSWTAAGGGEAT
jgi:hypothetical protein